jgi:spermidine synthase
MKKQLPPHTPAASAPQPELPSGLRMFLYVTSGVAGAAIMIVEILGARMLAPYVGTSHFVWTAQIAVTLAALACGYYAGGRLVDRAARLGRLYWAILAAAAWLALTVALREWVVYQVLDLPLAASSLLASVFLFFVPLGLLAMTGPFLVRMLTKSVNDVGGNVGRLSAISTIGSFLGTGVIGYVLIPLVPNSYTMFGTSALLVVIVCCYFGAWNRKAARLAVMAVVAAAGLAAGCWGMLSEGLHSSSLAELYRANSSFGMLQVVQARSRPFRYYLDDYLIQNTYDVEQRKSASMFTYMLEDLARGYAPALNDVLCIGMGVGIVPRELAQQGARVDVVEINLAVVKVAEKYFDLDTGAFRLFIGDGRYYVNRSDKKYDAVILDAFLGDSMPTHLMSREAFLAMKRVLQPDGVLVINTFVDFSSPKDFLGASLYKTLASVFPSVKVHGARGANTLFVASSRADLSLLHPPDLAEVHRDAAADVRAAFAELWTPDPKAGIVLTDDYNPVEYYDAANRERLRHSLALSIKLS